MPERIGFIGLGIMGSRMAANVRRAGFPLTVWTHTPGKAARWAAEHGAVAVETPAEVARASEIVVSMVVDGEQVASVLLGGGGPARGVNAAGSGGEGPAAGRGGAGGRGEAGDREDAEPVGEGTADGRSEAGGGGDAEPGVEAVVDGAHDGLLCVDMSTIAPTDTRRIGAALAARGVRMLDAPVTGSAPRAEAGTLTIMAGGAAEDFARARPLLEAMGQVIVHVGALGQGEMLKLINNSVGAANAAALAEALLLARASGLDLDAFAQVLANGSGASAQLELKADAMRAHDYTPLFKTAHMLKDVRLCLDQAQAAGMPFPAAAHARDLLAATVGRGHGEQDYAALIEAAEGLAGRRL
jgi:3-hydroxyisobutyrate dehydrogenase-like beta-hydroxyacid dehydrogenase